MSRTLETAHTFTVKQLFIKKTNVELQLVVGTMGVQLEAAVGVWRRRRRQRRPPSRKAVRRIMSTR
eukprot:SAG22_NODE_1400_length_4502_cov_10.780831_4_plen_66_part_00